jgi:cobyrinic acid a,c-diamide synthase
LPRVPTLALPSRHLGLVQAREIEPLPMLIESAAEWIATAVDLRRLVGVARPSRLALERDVARPLPPLGRRIALADDDAFSFCYPATIEGWRAAGAAIAPFSPLADQTPAEDCDAVYLPGGYPELHAGRIAANRRFLDGLRSAATRGAVVYGECGGYMVLGRGLVDAEGNRHAMAGLLPVETSFAERRLHLGYRDVATSGGGPLGRPGTAYRGHEFHYASLIEEGGAEPLFLARNAAGAALGRRGTRAGSVMGSFVHLVDRA